MTEVKWLRHGTPLPDGWRLVEKQPLRHHQYYSFLIERVDMANGGERPALSEESMAEKLRGEGTKTDHGKVRLGLIPTEPMRAVARVLGYGAEKYGDDNWRRGMEWHRMHDAALRHLAEFWDGVRADPDTGESPLAHAICMLMFLMEHDRLHLGRDDRPLLLGRPAGLKVPGEG